MNNRGFWISALATLLCTPPAAATAAGTAFTYQGRLLDQGAPVDGVCDLSFTLFDSASGGTPIGSAQTAEGVTVSEGLVNVTVDFGAGAFNGEDRWMEIAVRCPTGEGDFAALAPRQPLTPSPYAVFATATPWQNLIGIPAGFDDDVDDVADFTIGAGLTLDDDQLAVDFAGGGTAATASRSDHDHGGQTWNVASPLTIEGGINDGAPLRVTNDRSNGEAIDVDSLGDGIRVNSLQDGIEVESARVDGIKISADVTGLRILEAQEAIVVDSAVQGMILDSVLTGIRINETDEGLVVTEAGSAGVSVSRAPFAYRASLSQYGFVGGGMGASGIVLSATGTDSDAPESMFGEPVGTGFAVANAGSTGFWAGFTAGHGLHIARADGDGARIEDALGDGLRIDSAKNNGVAVRAARGAGVLVEAAGTAALPRGLPAADVGTGFAVLSAETHGFFAGSVARDGIHIDFAGGDGIEIDEVTGDGINLDEIGARGIRISDSGLDGIQIRGAGQDGIDAHTTSASSYAGQFVNTGEPDGSDLAAALSARSGGGLSPDIILAANDASELGDNGVISSDPAVKSSDMVLYANDDAAIFLDLGGGDDGEFVIRDEGISDVFRVTEAGDVTADGTISGGGADFAELLPAEPDLEPGDVLAIGRDGTLRRSTASYQSTVVGVHSTKPGFLGDIDRDGSADAARVPLAVVGIVPVKASAENGAIVPGDLLVASATPGYAMRAGTEASTGTVIGKALEPLSGDLGRIQMLVMLQ